MNRILKYAVSALLALVPGAVVAQQAPVADDNDESLRISPELADMSESVSAVYSDYPWLNVGDNHIMLNGADWSILGDKLNKIEHRPFRIVLIGDSHIQADGATSVVRRTLHERYGSAGRGMITPLRMAGTNEPRDYSLTSSGCRWATARLLPSRGDRIMLFTGVTVCPADTVFDLNVRSTECDFSRIKLYYSGGMPELMAVYDSTGEEMAFDIESYDDGFVDILLESPVWECLMCFTSAVDDEASVIGGLELLGCDAGVEFSSIGNNGATYGSYLGVGTGRGLACMESDLVILSLGPNAAWGSMSDDDFLLTVDRLVSEIKRENPSVKILLTTPGEAQKALRRSRRSKIYSPHKKIGHFRDLLLDYGRRNSLPVYDFYNVAGGERSSEHWVKAGLFSRDRIHLSWPGYSLMGQLMSDALIEQFENLKAETINISSEYGARE